MGTSDHSSGLSIPHTRRSLPMMPGAAAPAAGVVTGINFAAGEQVEEGVELITLDGED